jgi:hypothetical protein
MGALNVTDDAKTQVRMSEENRTEQAGKTEEQDKRATSGYRKLDFLNITRNYRAHRTTKNYRFLADFAGLPLTAGLT